MKLALCFLTIDLMILRSAAFSFLTITTTGNLFDNKFGYPGCSLNMASDEEEYSYDNDDPFASESPDERESRMNLVRELQKSFYKDEESLDLDDMENDDEDDNGETIQPTLRNLPLWRVQWTELPGSQNVLNVHVPHYTNMFQKILKGQSKQWGEESNNETTMQENNYYFGHIYLPGGSENLDNPEYELQVGQIGTLMKISDSRQQADGRLTLVVQALERFEVTRVERSGFPYATADVAVLPDQEQVLEEADTYTYDDYELAQRRVVSDNGEEMYNFDGRKDYELARRRVVPKVFDHHPYEYRRVSIDECEIARDDGTVVGLEVSPLSNYDNTEKGMIPKDQQIINNSTLVVAETKTWIALDTMIRLLRTVSRGIEVPVPTQILGLLPTKKEPWPDSFSLDKIADRMEQRKEAVVGTHSKSPFVRVRYSHFRRAQRFSYVIWTLTDSFILPEGKSDYSPETILQTKSTEERLELATEKIEKICNLIRSIINPI